MDSLTDYEKTRLENIERNQKLLASLNLETEQLFRKQPKRKVIKGYRPSPEKKPKKENAPIVIRRSLRAKGIAPDSVLSKGVDDDLPTPHRHLLSFTHSPLSPRLRDRKTPFDATEVYQGRSDDKFVKTIMDVHDAEPLARLDGQTETNGDSFKLGKLSLKEENIARVVRGRVLNVRFFPTHQRRLIVSGDKFGHVGFWDVDYVDDEENGSDGVYLYCPHSAPVSGISIHPFALSKVFTSSYDGFIRMMDIEDRTFHMIYSSSDAIFSFVQCPKNSRLLYFGEGSGYLKIWDSRAGNISTSVSLHTDRINSIDFHPSNNNLMLTSSTDATACIWDLRNIRKTRPSYVATVNHEKAVHSAYFSPTGNLLATTSYDNRVGLLRGTDIGQLTYVRHNNQTSRWISSFRRNNLRGFGKLVSTPRARAIWGWDDSYLFIGNTRRAVDVISTVSRTTTMLESPLMTAIPCRFAAHPYMSGNLAGSTGGGQVYMWTTS